MTKIGIKRHNWEAQANKVFAEFFKRPGTMFQVSLATGVDRANTCRFTAQWKKANTIQVVKIAIDPLTGFQAQYLSTNPEHSQKGQLNFFE